jgi:nucleoside-diphosphate-sugar epimerase
MESIKKIFVTGGAGYVGSVLVPKLLQLDYQVKVLDLFIYGSHVLDSVKDNPNLEQIKGDIRDRELIEREIRGCDAVIHLACISNDPSFELDPELGKSINYDSFLGLVDVSKEVGVKRFIFASSSSVYGLREEENVTEDLPLNPLTDYSKYKAMCEEVLLGKRAPGFSALILRPATVCGYSPRLRLDLTVNILSNHAFHNRLIKVFGGAQMRPNIHIEDVTDLYIKSLEWPEDKIDGNIFNAGYENHRVSEIAEMAKKIIGEDVEIVTTPTDDNRSYHISSEKIKKAFGFVPRYSIEDAIEDLLGAFHAKKVENPMDNDLYYNIKRMQQISLR